MLDSSDPSHRRRLKLIDRLKEQQNMAQAMIDNKPFIKMSKVWVEDKDAGIEVRKMMPVPVRQWYWQYEGIYYIHIFYGRRKISLRNGKSAVVVGQEIEKLIPVIGILINAVEAGELDLALKDAYVRKPVE